MKIKFGLLATKKPIEEMFEVAKQSSISHIEIDLIKEHSYVESFVNELKKIKFLGPLVSEVFSRTPQETRKDFEKYLVD